MILSGFTFKFFQPFLIAKFPLRHCERSETTQSKKDQYLMKQPAVYIITNKCHGTLYTGVTSYLAKRIHEHKTKSVQSFSGRYHCTLLVYYEIHDTMLKAITREKQIKAGSRSKKIRLIESRNPFWDDLYQDVCE